MSTKIHQLVDGRGRPLPTDAAGHLASAGQFLSIGSLVAPGSVVGPLVYLGALPGAPALPGVAESPAAHVAVVPGQDVGLGCVHVQFGVAPYPVEGLSVHVSAGGTPRLGDAVEAGAGHRVPTVQTGPRTGGTAWHLGPPALGTPGVPESDRPAALLAHVLLFPCPFLSNRQASE